ncbi:MAG: BON domain-containing protein [Gammaproteobacteria bacterium]|nr:BON domain-containing protein [Gammaproteobacteria bacterium]
MTMYKLYLFIAALTLASCTTILVQTTPETGMQEDPTERTAGAVVEDQAIETKILVNLKSQDPFFRDSRLQVVSYNGVVLLAGQIATEELKARATVIASQASTKIKRIHNELNVSSNAGFATRSSDAWIGTKARTMLMTSNDVPSAQINVVVENGALYLMGLISQEDGERAANLVRNVSGVNRVVKVFEYIN